MPGFCPEEGLERHSFPLSLVRVARCLLLFVAEAVEAASRVTRAARRTR